METSRFEGASVIVTGAASGIGFEMARQFLAEGAHVMAADLTTEGLPPGCSGFAADVSAPRDVEALVRAAISEMGPIDVLCNNAGIGSTADVLECSVDEWDRVFAVNVRGVFLGIKYTLPSMLEKGSGVIINTASAAGLIGLRDRAAYCASKGAVISLTKQVAVQYASKGIRCNCICPGTIDSPWVGRLLDQAANPAEARAALVARQPLGRLGDPAEVAAAALYLASPEAAFCTGTALVIDGGIVAA